MSEDTRKNMEQPLSLKEQQEIERLSKNAIDLAHQFVAVMFAPPDLNLLKQEIAYLQKNKLDPDRRDLSLILVRMALWVPLSWKECPDSYAVRSYFSEMLEGFVQEYGEEPVRQLLIEDFSMCIIRQERAKDDDSPIPLTYSNKELAIAFNVRMSLGEKGTTNQMSPEWLQRMRDE